MSITAIVAQLKAASEAYYNTGVSLLTDAEFDALVDQLRELDPKNDFLKTVGAPPAGSLFKPVKHAIAMGSQEKVKTLEELGKWWDKLPVKEVVVQWKYDGCSLSLEYKKGKLVRAVSRGDGKVGEDVTVNILRSTHIIKQLPTPFTGFIRGECLLYKEDFKKYWPDGSNPRNQGNGVMRSKDGAGCEHLRVLPYDVVGIDTDFTGKETEEVSGSTELQKLQFLESCGFQVHLMQKLTKLENVEKAHEAMGQAREKLPFEVDGIVVKLNDCAASEAMGVSDDRPKGQRAYKWEALGAETLVESIEWTVGHTGAVIPTFKVQTREIGGTQVSSVLMNNAGYCEAMDVAIGDKVLVVRAGDVIPHIQSVIERPKSREWKPPTACPSCKSKLVRKDIHLVCENTECAGQKVRLIRRWLTALDIKFIGPEIEQALFDSGMLKTPADLYGFGTDYGVDALADVKVGAGRLGETRVQQILAEIDKTRELPLHEFMGALGIQFLGVRAAKHLVEDNGFDTIEKFMDPELIRTGKGKPDAKVLGPAIREGVAAGVEANLPLIKKLLKVVKIAKAEKAKPVATGGKLSGRAVCFTGVRPTGAEQEKFESLGGVVRSSVSKNCTHLIVRALGTGSNKAMYAQELGLDVATYDQFKEWLK